MAKKNKEESPFEKFSFFHDIKTGNKYADMNSKPEFSYIDTGSFALNAIYSGDMTKGFHSNKMVMLAGKEAVGKTYFTLRAHVKPLVNDNRFIFYIDTENAMTEELMTSFGIEPGTFKIIPEGTVEETRKTICKILDTIEEKNKNNIVNKYKCAFIIDSLGQLTTLKTEEDSSNGVFKKDYTKQVELKRLFAAIIKRMGVLDIPLIVTNHVYSVIGSPIPNQREISGGSGALYSASIIVELSKQKKIENKQRTGSIITAKIRKSRMVRESLSATFYLDYKYGLDKWYGVHKIAQEAGMIEEFGIRKHGSLNLKLPEIKSESDEKQKIYVIKNPEIEPNQWITCFEKDIHKESTIGTIFKPLNEWVIKNYTLSSYSDNDINDINYSPFDISDDDISNIENDFE